MWSPSQFRASGPGNLLLDGERLPVEHGELRLDARTGAGIELSGQCRVAGAVAEKLRRQDRGCIPVTLDDHGQAIVAPCFATNLQFTFAATTVKVSLKPRQISRIRELPLAVAQDRHPGITLRVRVVPGSDAFRSFGLPYGLSRTDDYKREVKFSHAFAHCGRFALRLEDSHERVEDPGERGSVITIVRQSVIALHHDLEDGEDAPRAHEELNSGTNFLTDLLTCLYRRPMEIAASCWDYVNASESPRWMRQEVLSPTTHNANAPLARSFDLDGRLFSLFQRVACALPVSDRLVTAASHLAQSFEVSPAASFPTRILAIETLVAEWLDSRDGRGKLKSTCEAGAPTWPRGKSGEPLSWNSRWLARTNPPLSTSLWACLSDLDIDFTDVLGDAGEKPPFVQLRDDMLHGRHPGDPVAVADQSDITAVLALRLLMALLGVPRQLAPSKSEWGGTVADCWFGQRQESGPRYQALPRELLLPGWLSEGTIPE